MIGDERVARSRRTLRREPSASRGIHTELWDLGPNLLQVRRGTWRIVYAGAIANDLIPSDPRELAHVGRDAKLAPDWIRDMTQDTFAPEMGESHTVDQPGSVAIVHDYLTQKGGAERVVLAMHLAFPEAPIYTSLYEPELTFPEFKDVDIRPSYLNHSRLLRGQHRLSFPLLAHAFSTMKVDEKVVLCSSSGWAHGVHAKGPKLVYCHTPARWLYKTDEAFRRVRDSQAERRRLSLEHLYASPFAQGSLRVVAPFFRRWDRKAVASASKYFANGTYVSEEEFRRYTGLLRGSFHHLHSG